MSSRFQRFRPLFFIFGTLSALVFALLVTLFVKTEIPDLNSYVGTQALEEAEWNFKGLITVDSLETIRDDLEPVLQFEYEPHP